MPKYSRRDHFPRQSNDVSLSRPVESALIRQEEEAAEQAQNARDDKAEADFLAAWAEQQLRIEAATPGTPTTLYLMFGEPMSAYLGIRPLLYVGITKNTLSRLADHRRDKTWMSDVDLIVTEQWKNRKVAERREAYLIRSLGPVYNRSSGTLKQDQLGETIDKVARLSRRTSWPLERKPTAQGIGMYAFQLAYDRHPSQTQDGDRDHILPMPDHIRRHVA